MGNDVHDPIRLWFTAGEDLGEFIGIRFGRIAPGTTEPEWIFLSHKEFDGIGGLADILRKRGAVLGRLAQIRHPASPSRMSVLRTLPKFLKPRRPIKWAPFERTPQASVKDRAPAAVAWHVFNEEETLQVRRICRKAGITVNSFLVKNLTKAVRPFLEDFSSTVPWMIPVNLRGKILRDRDTGNYSSYVSINVQSYETVHDIHHNIYAALAQKEHWANWYSYQLGRALTHGMRKTLVRNGWVTPMWHLGAFSNLGDWDSDKEITQRDCMGSWLFAPPVLRFQQVGAGCVTFQNQLALLIQVHPELTTNAAFPKAWMQHWVKEIEFDVASGLADPLSFPRCNPG